MTAEAVERTDIVRRECGDGDSSGDSSRGVGSGDRGGGDGERE